MRSECTLTMTRRQARAEVGAQVTVAWYDRTSKRSRERSMSQLRSAARRLNTPRPSPRRVDAMSPRVQTGGIGLADEAHALRLELVEALHATGGGHFGGSLSVLDITLVLYRRILRVAPGAPYHPERDRFILSKGHAALALYAVLRQLGFFDLPLTNYAQFGSPLQGHPEMHALAGIDFSTGSLGQGLSVGLGMATALRHAGRQVWVVLGDGECQEGQVWEAAMLASRFGLDNLHAIIDANGFQETFGGPGSEPVPGLASKWAAFGWRVFEVAAHDHVALEAVLNDANKAQHQPSMVIASSIKGYGIPLIESDPIRFHCSSLTEDEYSQILASGT